MCEAETEAGRLKISIPKSLKATMKPLQRIWSSYLRRVANKVATIASFGDTTNILNEFLHRDEDAFFAKMTVADTIYQDGRDKQENDKKFMQSVFEKTSWLTENGCITDIDVVPGTIKNPTCSNEGYKIACQKRDEIAKAYNEGRADSEQISDKRLIELIDVYPEDCVYIMVDSVISAKQKEHRNVHGVTGMIRDKKTVSVANAYVLSREGYYHLTAQTEDEVVRLTLAYVVHHDMLCNRELVFFADGATSIKSYVDTYFGFRTYAYILDWFHLRKKCYELFSMALYGGKANKERNAKIRYEFEKKLWAGNPEAATAYLESLKSMEAKVVKNDYYLNEIKRYISPEKKGDDITSYALRR